MCAVIVVCNLFVTRVLCFIGRSKTPNRLFHYDLVTREKLKHDNDSTESGNSNGSHTAGSTLYNHGSSVTSHTSSPDEIKFAKLMAFLSISFVICWMPQMVRLKKKCIIPYKLVPFFIEVFIHTVPTLV